MAEATAKFTITVEGAEDLLQGIGDLRAELDLVRQRLTALEARHALRGIPPRPNLSAPEPRPANGCTCYRFWHGVTSPPHCPIHGKTAR